MSRSGSIHNSSHVPRQPAVALTFVKGPSGREHVFYNDTPHSSLVPHTVPGGSPFLSSVSCPPQSPLGQATSLGTSQYTNHGERRLSYGACMTGGGPHAHCLRDGFHGLGVPAPYFESSPEELSASERRPLCHRLKAKLRAPAPKASADGAFSGDDIINVQLTERDLEELMALVRSEQDVVLLKRRDQQRGNLGAVVEEQCRQMRILSLELKKTKAVLEEKEFLLEAEKQKTASLTRQLRMLRRLRRAEKQEHQQTLKCAENQLERELENYMEAAHRQGLSFFGRTTESGAGEFRDPDGADAAFADEENFPGSSVAGGEPVIGSEGRDVGAEDWDTSGYSGEAGDGLGFQPDDEGVITGESHAGV
ncbi:hypothetical protein BESB_060320 [Besnoitia besnoiti]|uniref:Uncharacterized protein n=1 Tax=Besnoitia besnoiti TaxID=94643 RepID=A0A2A9MAY8_BESBE|nr:hypothetical protein BESB_060320 [Besnoitia besnoiti]PFH35145.1 hypothetical protein BESB_060320 [Besnoitia besnoiti]